VILNGAPRAGKSSIARALQERSEQLWISLGVDALGLMTPKRFRPGIGLRPGGERPDLEPYVVALFAGLYEAIAALSCSGLNVVADVGHHDSYSQPRHILRDCARRLSGLPVLFVGVHCAIDEIMARRRQGQPGREGRYLTSAPGTSPPLPVQAWQQEVHRPGLYDVEVDTTKASPETCAELVILRLAQTPGSGPTAFERLAADWNAEPPRS
jgi:chloramphenicol 3-O phosphotransferase